MHAGVVLLAALTLGQYCHAQSQLRVTVDTKASSTVGQLDTHARAISCTNGGWFSSLRFAAAGQDGAVPGVELCCATRSNSGAQLWYEGASSDSMGECAWFGQEDRRAAGAFDG